MLMVGSRDAVLISGPDWCSWSSPTFSTRLCSRRFWARGFWPFSVWFLTSAIDHVSRVVAGGLLLRVWSAHMSGTL